MPYETETAQRLIVLLHALYEMGGIHARQETCTYIETHDYLTLRAEDLKPFETQSEPSWRTRIAYMRKTGIDDGLLVSTNVPDAWEISRKGVEYLEGVRSRIVAGIFEVRRCYLWTPAFRKRMDPAYVPSTRDWNDRDDILKDASDI
jgi:hypothetical protein